MFMACHCSLYPIYIYNMFIHFRALKDAERAITLAKTWAKGYFRQGRALAGLKVSNQMRVVYSCVQYDIQ